MPSTTVTDAAAAAAAAPAEKPVSSIAKKTLNKARKLKPVARSALFLKENLKAVRRRTAAMWDFATKSPMFLEEASYDGQMTRFRVFNAESPFSRGAVELVNPRLSKALEQKQQADLSSGDPPSSTIELDDTHPALLAVEELSQQARYKAAMAPLAAEAKIAALKVSAEWDKMASADRADKIAELRESVNKVPTRFKIKVGGVYYEPVPKSNKKIRIVPQAAIHAASSGAVAAAQNHIAAQAAEMNSKTEPESKRAPVFLPFTKDAQLALGFGLEAIAKSAGLNALAVFESSNVKRISPKAVHFAFRVLADKDASGALSGGGGFVVHDKARKARKSRKPRKPRSEFIADEAGEA